MIKGQEIEEINVLTSERSRKGIFLAKGRKRIAKKMEICDVIVCNDDGNTLPSSVQQDDPCAPQAGVLMHIRQQLPFLLCRKE